MDDPREPAYPVSDIYTHLPANQRRAYDIRKILACLFDGSEFMELKGTTV